MQPLKVDKRNNGERMKRKPYTSGVLDKMVRKTFENKQSAERIVRDVLNIKPVDIKA